MFSMEESPENIFQTIAERTLYFSHQIEIFYEYSKNFFWHKCKRSVTFTTIALVTLTTWYKSYEGWFFLDLESSLI